MSFAGFARATEKTGAFKGWLVLTINRNRFLRQLSPMLEKVLAE
jgi:hypothetical protein